MTSSSVQQNSMYEVFLSFRGEDTRKNIVDLLFDALQKQGIYTYKDDERMDKGEEISKQLERSIMESRLYIMVFSKNYASSSWCLNELVKIIECCSKTKDQTAIPLFYDVEPTEVRNQIGAVGLAFAKHAENKGCGRWKDALRKAAGLAGWELKTTADGFQAKFIEKVVQDIKTKLHYINFKVDEKLVGMRKRVDKVISSLELDREDDVRMVGIKGMGGAGKTTMSQAVFYEICIRFEGKSFVEKVGERSKSSGLKEIQKKVLSDVLNDKSIVVDNEGDGKNMMRMRLGNSKALIVLDDVDDVEQLMVLAGNPSWFKPGSRIIITTRNERMLRAHKDFGMIESHDINESLLSDEEAICLFSRCAFGREDPDQEYVQLSNEGVRYAAGLPLTLKVLGYHLCDRSEEEWKDAIERLKKFPEEKTRKILELSFNGLMDDENEIFLDVACILKGERKDVAIRILENCGYHAKIGLGVLKEKSLVTISSDDRLLMHDLIQDMGMYVVRVEEDPRRHSRLWIKEEIEDILENDMGTEVTRSIKLVNTKLNPDVIMKGLRNMKKLRFFHVDSACTTYEYASSSNYNFGLPYDLKYLYWCNYPLCCLPRTFQAKKLVNLEMVRSNISELWEGEEKVLKELKFLNLENSHLATFDIGTTEGLETLNLKECKVFEDLQVPGRQLKLKILNLGGCNLRNLNLLEMIPCLEKLTLTAKEVQHLPDSLCLLRNLKFLKLESCWLLKQLPENLDRLNRLGS